MPALSKTNKTPSDRIVYYIEVQETKEIYQKSVSLIPQGLALLVSTQSDTQVAHALDGQDEPSIPSEPSVRLAGQGMAG